MLANQIIYTMLMIIPREPSSLFNQIGQYITLDGGVCRSLVRRCASDDDNVGKIRLSLPGLIRTYHAL